MKSKFFAYLFIFILVSCSENENLEDKKEIVQTPFNLYSDYQLFSEKLNLNDSIKFHFNLAVCEGNDHAYLTFIRINEGIELNSYLKGEYTDTSLTTTFSLDEFNLDSIISSGITDSLLNIPVHEIEKRHLQAECEITYQHDTLFLQDTTGLLGRLKHIQRFDKSLKSLYSEVEGFASIIIPPPPPPPLEYK